MELEDFEDVSEAEEVDVKTDVGDGPVLRGEDVVVAEVITVPAEGVLVLPIFSFALSRRCTSTREAYPARAFELALFLFDASAPPTSPPTAPIITLWSFPGQHKCLGSLLFFALRTCFGFQETAQNGEKMLRSVHTVRQ